MPEGVAGAAARALAKSPADRFATAAEFARALEEAGTAAPDPPSRPRAPTDLPSRPSRCPAVPPLLLGLGFLCSASACCSAGSAHTAPTSPRAPAPPASSLSSRSKTWATPPTSILPTASPMRSAASWLPWRAQGDREQQRGTVQALVQAAGNKSPHGSAYVPAGREDPLGEAAGGQSRVRVSPELVQVTPGSAATTRWQQPFDAALTDVFQVQADIAGQGCSRSSTSRSATVRGRDLAAKPTRRTWPPTTPT